MIEAAAFPFKPDGNGKPAVCSGLCLGRRGLVVNSRSGFANEGDTFFPKNLVLLLSYMVWFEL
ncbi:MAG: hypothetical protein ACO1N7_08295 [Sphingobacteriaceae bacterium]